MGLYKYVKKLWTKPKAKLGDLWKQRLIDWRKEGSTVRIERPTRIDRARSLGYKAKQGYLVVRQRILKGGSMRQKFKAGRRPKHMRRRQVIDKSHQQICEERANKKFVNCEVLNSYYVAEDGRYKWYEVILVDRSHPVIKKDQKINWICKSSKKGRAFRGLTSSGKKSRGMSKKGKGTEKIRPSKKANIRRRK